MVSKYEHRYKDEDPRRRARLVLGSILAAVAVPLMAVAVSAMTAKPVKCLPEALTLNGGPPKFLCRSASASPGSV
jgi:hypothetical protein